MQRNSSDTEKITINLGYVDLGSIDLLVKESVFANRTDFIRTAIRNELMRHNDLACQIKTREMPSLGISHLRRSDLEASLEAGEMLELRILGLLSISQDVDADLARSTIRSISVLGAFHASANVKAALLDRMV